MSPGKSFRKLFRRKSSDKDENGNRNKDAAASDRLIVKESKQASMTSRFTAHTVAPSDLNEPVVQKIFAENENARVIKTYPAEAKVRFGNDLVKERNKARVIPKRGDILNNNERNRDQSVTYNSVGTMSNKVFMVRLQQQEFNVI